MIFRKKKRMIDLSELQKRGVVRFPQKVNAPQTNSEGFIDFRSNLTPKLKKANPSAESTPTSNQDFFGFINSPANSSGTSSTSKFSTESDGYDKREVDEKMTNLDNKLYKLEQRIELLERKLDVNRPDENVGVMGW